MPQILRKLGHKEKLKIAKRFVLNFRVKSTRIDLFADLDRVQQAIEKWKIKHVLLRARIISKGVGSENEFCFVIDDNEQNIKTESNVKFLKLAPGTQISECAQTQLIDLLIEKYLAEDLDPLWKMAFFEVKQLEYEVIIVFNHAIADTISGYNACLNLLHMIEMIHENKGLDEAFFSEMKVLPCLEELFHRQIAQYKPQDLPSISKCKFIDEEKAKSASFNNSRFSALFDLENEFLYEVIILYFCQKI
jgi:hypothetical protein